MVILRKVGVLSLAKIETILMAIFGLILGLFYGIASSFVNLTESATSNSLVLGWWSVLVFPVLYAIIGFVAGAIGALLYNIISRWVGGVELDLRK
jgi:high-affinity nickel permease